MTDKEMIEGRVKDVICDRAVDCKDCDANETCGFKDMYKDIATAISKEYVRRDEVDLWRKKYQRVMKADILAEYEELERQLDKQLKKVAKLESELDTLKKKLDNIKNLPQTIQIQEIQHIMPMELNVDKETVAAMLDLFPAFKRNKVRIIIEPIGE